MNNYVFVGFYSPPSFSTYLQCKLKLEKSIFHSYCFVVKTRETAGVLDLQQKKFEHIIKKIFCTYY